MSKTAIMQLYEMLDKGQVSEIAEIKEWFLNVEKAQIIKAHGDGIVLMHALIKDQLAKHLPKLNMDESTIQSERVRSGEQEESSIEYYDVTYNTK